MLRRTRASPPSSAASDARPTMRPLRLCRFLLAAALLPEVCGRPAGAQEAGRLPFYVGETLTYRARVERFGDVGTVRMWVEGPVALRGDSAVILRFDFRARIGVLTAHDRTESWLDPERMAALRFHKHERHILSRRDEKVEVFPADRRWEAADGTSGESATDAPLDELSFMYALRTIALPAGQPLALDRHFDKARNPVVLRVLGTDTVPTPAGSFRTVVVEMRVKDPRRYRGEGVLKIHFTDDHCRIPVRIESTMPVIGTTVMTLESHNHPASHHVARLGP